MSTSWIKNKTTMKKNNRYTQDNFDLDLTYITARVIGMSYPAKGTFEKIYRNSVS